MTIHIHFLADLFPAFFALVAGFLALVGFLAAFLTVFFTVFGALTFFETALVTKEKK